MGAVDLHVSMPAGNRVRCPLNPTQRASVLVICLRKLAESMGAGSPRVLTNRVPLA